MGTCVLLRDCPCEVGVPLQSKPAVDEKSSDLVPVLKVTSELDFQGQIHYN